MVRSEVHHVMYGPLVALVVVALAACGKSEVPTTPCERDAKLEVRIVDNDAPFMKKLFAHVGSEGREGRPRDPAAIEAGVRADIDAWRTEQVTANGFPRDSQRETDYYLLALDRPALDRYLASYERPPDDREIRIEFVAARPDVEYLEARAHWRTYYVMKESMLDNREIGDVELATNPVTEGPMLVFELTSEGKRAFAKGTAATVGKKVATMIDGAILSAPIINGAITGGRFSINLPTQVAAEALLAKLRCASHRHRE